MTKDNKLEQKEYNKYYELKEYLGRLQDEYQTCHTRYMGESDTRQRAMARKDLDEISLRIRRTQQEMNKIKNLIHLKDSMDMLKLSGFTVDEEVSPKFKKVMEEYGKGELKSSSGEKVTDPKQAKAIAYSEAGESKDGGPGSGIKGHTTEKKPSSYYTHRAAAQNRLLNDIDEIKYEYKKEGKKLSHGKLLQELGNYGWEDDELIGLKLPLSLDSCGEKVYTKGTEDDDATKGGAIKEYGDKNGEKMEDSCSTKDDKFEVMYTIGHFHDPETLKDKKEIIQANSAGEARRIIENKWKGNLNRIIQITRVHDADPKVAEAEAMIKLCGGVM